MTEVRYRYQDGSLAPSVWLAQYQVLRRTDKGAWIRVQSYEDPREERFVLDGPGKRFAHETREQAAAYYLARKKSSALKFEHRLRRQQAFAQHVEEMMKAGRPIDDHPDPGAFFEFEA